MNHIHVQRSKLNQDLEKKFQMIVNAGPFSEKEAADWVEAIRYEFENPHMGGFHIRNLLALLDKAYAQVER